jgi:hypothetical protein
VAVVHRRAQLVSERVERVGIEGDLRMLKEVGVSLIDRRPAGQ